MYVNIFACIVEADLQTDEPFVELITSLTSGLLI